MTKNESSLSFRNLAMVIAQGISPATTTPTLKAGNSRGNLVLFLRVRKRSTIQVSLPHQRQLVNW